jgi:hypothetical protein
MQHFDDDESDWDEDLELEITDLDRAQNDQVLIGIEESQNTLAGNIWQSLTAEQHSAYNVKLDKNQIRNLVQNICSLTVQNPSILSDVSECNYAAGSLPLTEEHIAMIPELRARGRG